ncbi:amino acid adenylation domain-containing protein [Paenibacillus nicotianae]|uniref:Amino acid adenylation domain-containing protein n=1 Tax=Paenibacillus nicotianae TaxID=1526551 RepID=A0ABW4UT10_9BACL
MNFISKQVTLNSLFESTAKRIPHSIAIQCKDQSITYHELFIKVDHIAQIMRKENVVPKDVVAIMMTRSIDMIVGILAILKIGATYLPIDPEYPDERIKMMLEDSGTILILTNITLIDKINFVKIGYIDKWYQTVVEQHTPLLTEIMPNDIAYLIYTSGSTGKPKGVMIEHQSIVNLIEGITQSIQFSESKKILALTTVSFDIFLIEALLPLTTGTIIIIAGEDVQKNPKLIADILSKEHIDMLQMTPSMMQLLINYNPDLESLRNLKELMIGGEFFPDSLFAKIKNTINAKIYNMYGPTETTVWSTISDLTGKEKVDIGKPIQNTQLFVIDENNILVQEEEEGELYIGGIGLARGYLNRSDLTQERFIHYPSISDTRLYKTGDQVKRLPNGNIQYLGRIDNQVKIRGHRIEIEEIEQILLNFKSIDQVAVCSWKDKNNQSYLCAYYTSNQDLLSSSFRDFLDPLLPYYMHPLHFIRIDKIPQTLNGKIDRKNLPDPEQLLDNVPAKLTDHKSNVDLQVIEIIQNNLNIPFPIENITGDHTLADLGLDSITFIKIIISIEVEFEFEFEDQYLNINQFPKLYTLIAYIEDRKSIQSNL